MYKNDIVYTVYSKCLISDNIYTQGPNAIAPHPILIIVSPTKSLAKDMTEVLNKGMKYSHMYIRSCTQRKC